MQNKYDHSYLYHAAQSCQGKYSAIDLYELYLLWQPFHKYNHSYLYHAAQDCQGKSSAIDLYVLSLPRQPMIMGHI